MTNIYTIKKNLFDQQNGFDILLFLKRDSILYNKIDYPTKNNAIQRNMKCLCDQNIWKHAWI